MNKSLNIFDLGKKELTQDAIINWLFNCARSKGQYESAGKKFIRELLDLKGNPQINVYYVKQQMSGIDVYAEIIVDNTVHAVIIENKVETNLHDNQLVKYYNNIVKKISHKSWLKNIKNETNNSELETGKIYCIVIKKGYIDALFLREMDKEVKEIGNDAITKLYYLYDNGKNISNKEYEVLPFKELITGIRIDDKVWKDYKKHINNKYKEYEKLGKKIEEIIKEDYSLLAQELVWDELKIDNYSDGTSKGNPHTFKGKNKNGKKYYFNIRIEKKYTQKCLGKGTLIVMFEFYKDREENGEWNDKEKEEICRETKSIRETFDRLGIDPSFIYSYKEKVTDNNSNKMFCLRLQYLENGKIKTISFKKLRKLVDETWVEY